MENHFSEITSSELLIGEVKKYPETWDVADETYCDRTKKRESWAKICNVLCDDFKMKSDQEKNEICNIIVKKWINIKDTYVKSLKQKLKSGQAAGTPNRYIFAAQLSFLDSAVAQTETHSSLEDTMTEDIEQQQMEKGPEKSPFYDGNSSRKRKRNLEDSLIEFMQSPIPQPIAAPEPNDDRSFFESIIPFIKDFTEDQKKELRCEFLSVIKRMRKSFSSNNTCNNMNLPSTPQHVSTSNNIYASLTHPQFPHSFPPLPKFSPNFSPEIRSPLTRANLHSSPNFFPEIRSPLIRTNLHSSPNISSPNFFPEAYSPHLTVNAISSTNLLSQQLSQQAVTRCSTPVSSRDKQPFSDDENLNLFKDT